MRRDHKPYFVKRLLRRLEHSYTEHFLRPQLESLGEGHRFMKPWNLRLHGGRIHVGKQVHLVTVAERKVRLCTWEHGQHRGQIHIGDYVLICPGVRIDSALEVRIGNSSMLAAGVYITDANWHGIYDRTEVIGTARQVVLGENVWIGDGATLCKGVRIGDDSIVGAGSVVVHDVPAGCIVAGNPAAVVRKLDADRVRRTRQQMFADPDALARDMEMLDRQLLAGNSLAGWLRSLLAPRAGD